jgi:hypothetical protein
MARQYRMQSLDLYSKLGIKPQTSKTRSISIFEDGSSTFHLTEARRKPSSHTVAPKLSQRPVQIQSPIKFEKQIPRPDITKNAPDVNANRFVAFNHSPLALTTTRRIPSPNFSLYPGRKKTLMYSSLEDQPQYTPNYTQVWKSTDRGLVAFNKLQGRKDRRPTSQDVARDIDYKCVDKKVQSPNLGKAQAKPSDPVLPAFMLQAVSRGNSITDKTLEMNSYKNTEFLPLTSSFGNGWKQADHITAQPIKGKCPKIVKILTKTLSPF